MIRMPMRSAWVALLLGAAVACSSGSTPDGPRLPSSRLAGGTRLKANWFSGPDGVGRPQTRWLGQFHDTLLDIDCDFEVAGDGVLRCLPVDPYRARTLGGPSSYTFADPACTRRLISPGPSCLVPPVWHAELDPAACPARHRRWAVGARVADADPVYDRDATGACVPYALAAPFRGDFYPLGAELDATAYASAVVSDGETHGGYTEVRLVAEDGAVQLLGFKAVASSQLVMPAPAADGQARLLPLPADDDTDNQGLSYSMESTCTTGTFTRWGACTVTPAYRQHVTSDASGCSAVVQVFPVGPPLTQLYDSSLGSTCHPVTVPGLTGYAVGTEVPPATFPTSRVLDAPGRLSRRGYGVGAEWRWDSDEVFDTTLGRGVGPSVASDGSLRWRPYTDVLLPATQGYGTTWYFSDAACTKRLANTRAGPCQAQLLARLPSSGCGAATAYAVLPLTPYSGQAYERRGPDGFCEAQTTDGGPLYAIGTELPPSTFASATLEFR
jgi:hypothetical protein